MSIIRIQDKTENFTIIYNEVPKSGMSLAAIGLWTYLMTLPKDWKINLNELQNHFSNGNKAVRTAFNELIEKGYAIRQQSKNSHGRFQKMNYKIFESAQLNNKQEELSDEEFDTDDAQGEGSEEGKERGEPERREPSLPDPLPLPKNDYERVEFAYSGYWRSLYNLGRLRTEEPVIDFKKTRFLLKNLFTHYSVEDIIYAIGNAFYDEWIVSGGFSLSTILSKNILSRLINSNFKKGVEKKEESPYTKYDPGRCPECGKELIFGTCPGCGYEND